MPRITAATVADHRASQHAALLEAALEILAGEGAAALTPAAVGARVGLARSSVYRYFSSTADILAQLVEDAIPRWAGVLAAAADGSGDLRERLRGYGAATLTFVHSRDYVLLPTFAAIDLPAECQARLGQLHETMIEPMRAIAAQAGHDHPDLVAHLGWSILGEGQRQIAAGADAEVVTAVTIDTLCRAVLT
ncbi:TetR/AcrR family transcriptional regulator [Nonomuraea sediminis]|uniref:TetR/AcrR family transcriptional regulator n=1 Tax=Nonomuraea sediminis TaxID=2835864 RepID=UPI001BDC66E5|nr:TetR/AcrR family transcriptional regulator [Nonomuraea sediminis]